METKGTTETDNINWSNTPDDEWNYNLRCGKCDLVKKVKHSDNESSLFIDSGGVPSWVELNKIVSNIEKNCSWWDKYGLEWTSLSLTFPLFITGIFLLGFSSIFYKIIGIFIAGCCHMMWVDRIGHLALHNAMTDSKSINKLIARITQDFISGFSVDLAYEAHIKEHHPFTNIIGIGDSSSFKAPFLSRYVYLYFAPIFIPILMPLISVYKLLESKNLYALIKFIVGFCIGTYLSTCFISYISGFGFINSLYICFLYRSVMIIPYIHINVFQHIGLPMWTNENKPIRMYQMTSGCINIHCNSLMNFVFGPTLMSCHIEHHLFPRLSDSLCLKVQPKVKEFIKKAGLPYNETDYCERLSIFHKKYSELMVHAPPITHFIGLQ